MTVSLGMPAAPAPTLAPRRKTRQLQVGKVGVGSEHPISVQSMTTTLTSDVNATLQQIAELTAAGCDIVRVACPSQDDADALPAIARKSQIPVIADIPRPRDADPDRGQRRVAGQAAAREVREGDA
jgi:(E)-4-hydroxy-3-methylbut-2-enyl-diphosphate synthase